MRTRTAAPRGGGGGGGGGGAAAAAMQQDSGGLGGNADLVGEIGRMAADGFMAGRLTLDGWLFPELRRSTSLPRKNGDFFGANV
eukprot:3936193-Rhodomonas_salina.1